MKAESQRLIIVGAGPAGLSLAYSLQALGHSCLILEKGEQAGESFSRYPKHIFFGPWLNNTLPGAPVPLHWRLSRSTQPDYTRYLGEYAQMHHLPIRFGCEISSVERVAGGYRLITNQGPLECELLVNATGYFSKPYIPALPGLSETHVRCLHSSQVREVGDLVKAIHSSSGRILVVGQGLSAGESMCAAARQGFMVSLCHRGPLKIGPSPIQEALLSPFHWMWERMALRFHWPMDSNPPMAGGESTRLLSSGQVPSFPPIQRFETHQVVFENGQRRYFDLVLFCTGYRYAQDHLKTLVGDEPPELKDGFESVRAPGLFFLGLDHQRTYRSRFLRGIRRDAPALAERLSDRLAQSPSLEPSLSSVLTNRAEATAR